jgi:outer membrane protein assembly factor BamB
MSGYGNLLPGKAQASYFMTSMPVDDEAPPVEENPYGWWCFQYNAPNYGRNPHEQSFDPSSYSQKWYTDDAGRKYTGPVVTENYVYVVTNPSSVYTTTTYHITCFAMADGSLVWQKFINPQNEYRRGFTSPTYFEVGGQGRILVGGDRLWCFDAVTGAEIWTYRDDLSFTGTSAKVADGKVYIGAGGAIHCVDAQFGTEVWVSNTDVAGGEFIPAVADGKVYSAWGSDTLGYYWTCLDAVDGHQIWRVNTGYGTSHWIAPLVIGGRLYCCSYHQQFICLDITDGHKIWEYNEAGSDYDNVWMTAMTYWDDPSDGKRVIYFGGAYNAGVHAVKDLGDSPKLLWRVTNGIYADSSPIYCDGIIYIGDRATPRLVGLDQATGSQVFVQPTVGGVAGAAAFAYGRLVVPDDNGVYVYETP